VVQPFLPFAALFFNNQNYLVMKHYITTAILLAAGLSAHAQWYNDGAKTNAGAMASDWTVQATNTATASYSTAGSTGAPSSYGVFEHRGQSGSGASAALVNDGAYDATIFGRDYFLGPNGAAGQQEISGSSMPAFAELFLQNGAGQQFDISNTNGIRISNALTFANGITTTVRSNVNTGAIKFDDNAGYNNSSLGDAQHVNGYVTKTGDDAFTYPVGSGTDLRTLAIGSSASTTDQYSVSWIVGDPGTTPDPSNGNAMHSRFAVTAPIGSVSQAGQWDWIDISNSGAGRAITVSIPTPGGLGAAAADLRLVGWNGSSWVDLSGGPTASGNTENSTLSGTMIAGIQAIGVGSVSVLLPVVFSSFDAKKDGCNAVLSWTTEMEHNNNYFAVERSASGKAFTEIGRINANNGDMQHHYSFTDEQPASGLNQYRITQVDIDGKRTNTNIKALDFNCGGNDVVVVYPTITNGTVFIKFPAGYEQAEVKVYTTLGRELTLPGTGKVAGSGIHSVQLQGLAHAQYLIRIINGGTQQVFKVIHQ
jgi:hypothetical protein